MPAIALGGSAGIVAGAGALPVSDVLMCCSISVLETSHKPLWREVRRLRLS